MMWMNERERERKTRQVHAWDVSSSCRSLVQQEKNQDKVDWLEKSRWKSKTTDRLNKTINSAILTSNEDFFSFSSSPRLSLSLSLSHANRFFSVIHFSCLPIPLTCPSFFSSSSSSCHHDSDDDWQFVRFLLERRCNSLTMDYFFSVLLFLL